jgi:hypothetical protein
VQSQCVSDRTDSGVMVERLLSISGENSLSVNRKTWWPGKVDCRPGHGHEQRIATDEGQQWRPR